MDISIAEPADKVSWNKFVVQKGGSVYYLWLWGEIIERSLNYQRLFLLSKNNQGKITGILPLYYKKGIFDGRLATIPVTCYAGVLAKNSLVKQELIKFAFKWASEKEVGVKLYSSDKIGSLTKGIYEAKPSLADYYLKTNYGYQEFFNSISSSDRRRRIRKISKLGINVSKADKGDVNGFYKMHYKMMKKMRIPAFPKELFELTYKSFKRESFFIKSVYKKRIRAYMWSFVYGGKLYMWKNAYERGSSKDSVYLDALVNENIKYSCSRDDIKEMDFSCAGSKGGLAAYKMSWGFNPRNIYLIKNRQYENKSLFENLRRYLVGKAG